jgi:hypothetical protein
MPMRAGLALADSHSMFTSLCKHLDSTIWPAVPGFKTGRQYLFHAGYALRFFSDQNPAETSPTMNP